ncbi:tyrosine-type recombinase/integrase [Telmatocola sphagniphila]|uniref:Tyrosine-type recombinase/integrase n=1 Tax=Telmatocola sphagniphila TaxID=1123043 RepID=A0A8E6B5H6_9BACT|nr:tyrosine-type recombinase/integrase [Telmatocola sphagniphila]QVL32308.1 tyrosine-type recombinase/integrase [Telmatocola sphagniphila]
MSKKLPQLRLHRPSGQYYWWNGQLKRRIHCGLIKAEAEKKYHRDMVRYAERLVSPQPLEQSLTRLDDPTVAQALAAYVRHAQGYYSHDKRTQSRISQATQAVVELYGDLPAREFRAKHLKAVRAYLVDTRKERREHLKSRKPRPLSRRYINHLVAAIRAAWRWLGVEEIIPDEAATSVMLVSDLSEGRGGVERGRVMPVPGWVVEATLHFCNPVIAAMIRVQLLLGCRPSEIARLKRGDLSTSVTELVKVPRSNETIRARVVNDQLIWLGVPGSHKTIRLGKLRVLAFGPQAQEILKPFLDRNPEEYLFSTIEGGQRGPRKGKGFYETSTYGQAVMRAVLRANEVRAKEQLPLIPHWTPNQLRHSRATEIVERFDESHATAALGHSSPRMLSVYAEQAIGKAIEVARLAG